MTAPKHWTVIAVDEHGQGLGVCGHQHQTDLAAVRCPWEPDPWPDRCDLLVRQVRTEQPRRTRQLALPWGGRPLRQRGRSA